MTMKDDSDMAEESIKVKSFREYLKESFETQLERKSLLLEDVVAKIRQLWPKSDLFQMLEISRLSPDYNPQSWNGKLFIKLGDTQKDADDAEGGVIQAIKSQFNGNDEALKNFLKSSKIKIEKFTKVQKKSKTEQVEHYGILLSGPILMLAQLYAIIVGRLSFKDIETEKNVKKIETVDDNELVYLDLASLKLEEGFLQNLTVDGDISRSTRWLLNTSYRMLSKEKKSFKDVVNEMKAAKVALLLKWFNGDLKKQLKGINLDTIPTVAELKKIVDEAQAKTNSVDSLPQEKLEKGNLHPCAARRLDLFEAAKRFGAMTYTDGKWIIAVTTTFEQDAVFGRAKPKVVPGTFEIDMSLYRYDEPGMTQDQKDRRDGRNAEYLKDGIGFDNQWTETGWCTAGSYQACDGHWDYRRKSNRHWNNYTDYGKYPLIVCMNLQTGILYQFLRKGSSINFLDESDEPDSNYGGGERLLDHIIETTPGGNFLGKMIIQGEQVYYAEEYRKLLSQAQVAPDGFLIINTPDDIKKFQKIFSKFAGLKIMSTETVHWFDGQDLGNMPTIDMEAVNDATGMFKNAKANELRFRNCHPAIMTSMFSNAKVNKVEGLDTSKATTISDIFNGARINKRDDQSYSAIKIAPFTLNLENCSTMNRAFYNSHVDQVLIENTDKITSAQGAFTKCPFLKTLPNMRFKAIQGSGIGPSLVLDGVSFNNSDGSPMSSHSAEEIFAYSPKVVDSPNFTKEMEELEEFYRRPDEGSDLVDDRGYLIIKNQQMAKNLAKDFKRYPGIKIQMEDASGLFYGTSQTLFIKALDLTGVKDVESMFRETNILHLGKIEGTDDLINLKDMFRFAKIQQLPDMVCPKARQFEGMFAIKRGSENQTPLPPGTLMIGEAGFSTNVNWDNVTSREFYGTSQPKSLIKQVFGDAYSPFLQDFPWEMRKVSEAIANGLFKKYKLEPDENGWITVVSEDAARVLLMNKSVLTKCQGLKLAPNDGKIRGWFANVTDEHLVFPVVDLAGVTDAAAAFYYSRVKQFKGFINADNIVEAARMFSNTTVLVGSIDVLDSCKNLKSATQMFISCRVAVAPEKCKLPNLENGYSMFNSSTNCCPPVISKETIELPKLIEGTTMFSSTSIQRIEELELPACLNCHSMFSGNHSLLKVGTFSAPVATKTSRIFKNCSRLEDVKTVLVPMSTTMNMGFSFCQHLKMIGQLDIRSATDLADAFRSCNSLNCILMPRWCPRGFIQTNNSFYLCNLGRKYGKNAEKLRAYVRSKVGQAMARAGR